MDERPSYQQIVVVLILVVAFKDSFKPAGQDEEQEKRIASGGLETGGRLLF